MAAAGYKRKSRRRSSKDQKRKDKKKSHFQTVRSGGFDESQVICYLWDLVKSIKSVESGGTMPAELERRLRERIQLEMRRYFLRLRRRNVILIVRGLLGVTSVIILFGFLVGIDRVSGNSMYPYLHHGDWIIYSRVSSELKRDEVVVFENDGETYVKRIAGLPGDLVEISSTGGRVVINGKQVRESYVTLTDSGPGEEESGGQMGEPLTVMDGQFLVLGDNRSISVDSRDSHIGTVPFDYVQGRVILVIRWNH